MSHEPIRRKQDDARRQQALEAAALCAGVLKEQFGARQVYLFGSLAGQSPWHSRSDIDLAVEGLDPQKYFPALSALLQLLPEGLELDLVPLEEAPPELVARIKGEVTMSDNPKEALIMDIKDELTSLERIVGQAKTLLQTLPPEPAFIEISAAGKLAHDFYSGAERIFERIAMRLGPGVPTGSGWHILLLRSLEREAEGVRPAVITHELALRLVDYLGFRHVFRHSYGYELQWHRFRHLIEGLEETQTQLRKQLEPFMAWLQQP